MTHFARGPRPAVADSPDVEDLLCAQGRRCRESAYQTRAPEDVPKATSSQEIYLLGERRPGVCDLFTQRFASTTSPS
jgi:hypothetical protein